MEEILNFWNHLKKATQLFLTANVLQGTERVVKHGQAEVLVLSPSPTTLIFEEKGFWVDQSETSFTNRFRWTLENDANQIGLEHLRYGYDRPVFLFHLAPTKKGILESVKPHVCAQDTYSGSIIWDEKSIRFHWKITGPRKNDDLIYQYHLFYG